METLTWSTKCQTGVTDKFYQTPAVKRATGGS